MTYKKFACSVMVLFLVFGTALMGKNQGDSSQESASDMTVRRAGSIEGCEDAVITTNHFVLQPGESSLPIELDYSNCPPSRYVLFYGYDTRKSNSRQWTVKSKMLIAVTNHDTGLTVLSSSGRLLITPTPTSATYRVTNNGNKERKVRLRVVLRIR